MTEGQGDLSAALRPKVDWTIVAVLVALHTAGGVGLYLLLVGEVKLETLVLAAVWYLAAGFSITAGYHRHFAHRAYCANRPLRVVFLLFGAAAWQNSALSWVADHRAHHRFADRSGDPHDIAAGFFHAHALWLLRPRSSSANRANLTDLACDPDVVRQDRWYAPLAIAGGVLAPTFLASTWGDGVGGFFVAGFLRTTLGLQATFCVNSVAHRFGSQPGAEPDGRLTSARNNRFVAAVALGEGYHYFHHLQPRDYRAGFRRYDLDPTKWLIWSLGVVGLASDLTRTVSVRRQVLPSDQGASDQISSDPFDENR